MTTDLLTYVRERVDSYPGTRRELAEKAGVEYSWLTMWQNGHIPNPGVIQIQKLADYLKTVKRRKGANHAENVLSRRHTSGDAPLPGPA